MRVYIACAVLLLCGAGRSLHAQAKSVELLARTVLTELVAINTTVSEGATTPAAEKLAVRFRAAGFPTADVLVIGPTSKHKNLVVTWRGTTRGKPIVFNAHLDVVEAPKLEWSTNPFQLTEKDGWLYGRGVLDDKGPASAMIAAFLSARNNGLKPQRDLVLALTSGEESDVDNGVMWLLKQRRALVDGEYVLNLDAGGGDVDHGVVRAFALQAAEKQYMDVTLTVRGPGGHSSLPHDESPIDYLARALDRLGRFRFPVKLNDVVRAYLERRAPLTPGAEGAAMLTLAHDPDNVAAQTTLLKTPQMNALLRTTCVATMLRGGSAPNAMPQEVVATVNCRMLPGEPVNGVLDLLRSAVNDTNVKVAVLQAATPSAPSMPSAAIVSMLERVVGALYPNTPVIPYMETGATDGLWFRNAGIPVYGVAGFFVEPVVHERMHGRDERIPVKAYSDMVRYSVQLLSEAAAQR